MNNFSFLNVRPLFFFFFIFQFLILITGTVTLQLQVIQIYIFTDTTIGIERGSVPTIAITPTWSYKYTYDVVNELNQLISYP